MTDKVYEIDYEQKLFFAQKSFYETFKKEYVTDIYFLLLKYIDIICLYRKITDAEERKFICENLTSEIIDRMLESNFKIESSWKSYLYRRMNFFINDYHSKDAELKYRENHYRFSSRNLSHSDGDFDGGSSDFFDSFIDPKDYQFLDIDLDRNGVILRIIRKTIKQISDCLIDYFILDEYLFKYYFYLVVYNNNINCLEDLKLRHPKLRSVVIYSFNLYSFKLKEFIVNMERDISNEVKTLKGDKT
jgi:hypothetical protein